MHKNREPSEFTFCLETHCKNKQSNQVNHKTLKSFYMRQHAILGGEFGSIENMAAVVAEQIVSLKNGLPCTEIVRDFRAHFLISIFVRVLE